MKYYFKFIFVLLITLNGFSQKRGNVWFFGHNGAGIDFNTCPPQVLSGGWVNASNPLSEGSTTICDTNGVLLFYSNGYSVINANHALMNIVGSTYAVHTQNIIIPKPGQSNIYYLFVPPSQAGAALGVVVYSVIDMSLFNGLGGVTTFNGILRDTVGKQGTEKLTAVRHANGTDIWLIGHDYLSDKFFAYQISSVGINSVAVESSVGPIINAPGDPSNAPAIGELKASPDGTRLGYTCSGNGITAIFNFNSATGAITNPITLNINDGGVKCSGYGATFSPDNSKFYVTSEIDNGSSVVAKIFQFNIVGGNQSVIQNSRYTVSTASVANYKSLKIGPDKKVYVARPNVSYLSVINSPNSSGIACNFQDQGLSLNGFLSSAGLNNILEMFDTPAGSLNIVANSNSICTGSSATLQALGAITYSWKPIGNFTGANSSLIIVTPTISTNFSVTATDSLNCILATSFAIQIKTLPSLTVSSNVNFICEGSTALLTAIGASTYTWSLGPTTSTWNVNPVSTTIFSLSGTGINGCTNSQTITVAVDPCTNINKEYSSTLWKVFPSSSDGNFVIQSEKKILIHIYNQLGILIKTNSISIESECLDLTAFPSGVYIVRNSEDQSYQKIYIEY